MSQLSGIQQLFLAIVLSFVLLITFVAAKGIAAPVEAGKSLPTRVSTISKGGDVDHRSTSATTSPPPVINNKRKRELSVAYKTTGCPPNTTRRHDLTCGPIAE